MAKKTNIEKTYDIYKKLLKSDQDAENIINAFAFALHHGKFFEAFDGVLKIFFLSRVMRKELKKQRDGK